ncbi:TIMELESS-interacting protein [Tautogolabrus adspersus]
MPKPQKKGLFNIPDFDGLEDEAFPPLPPPHSPGQGGREDGDPFGNEEENGEVSKLADVPAAKRKGVKRPQPKLDSQRLISDRGLPALRTLFEDVQFKGKGREAEDLRLLMHKMENWAHRLFPKLQFEDIIDRVEKLGNKKEVQTCLKRIRLDMPLTHEDFMGEDEPAPEPHVFGDPDPFDSAVFPDDLQGALHSTPAPAPPPSSSPSPAAPSLTEEQRRRIELNRQRALERKLARQQQQTDPADSQTVDSSAPSDEPTPVSSVNDLDVCKAEEEVDKKEEAEEVDEDLHPEPDSSSNTQQQKEQPHRDSEASAESAQREREEESSLSAEREHNEQEDGDSKS